MLQGPEQQRPGPQEQNFAEVGGVAGNAVAEIDAPGQSSGGAVGTFPAAEEAADAPSAEAQQQRKHHEVARRGGNAQALLGQLHAHQTAQEAAHDNFVGGVVKPAGGRVQQQVGVFEQAQQARAEQGPGGGPDKNPLPAGVADGVGGVGP